jgi:eukaryotic-like serine/threonine-protein kinase
MADARRHIGSYEVLGLLGSGGMGEVYRGRDPKLGRDVAIKILAPDLATDVDRIARLDREARVLAALNHSSIGAIYGLETADGQPALILELVEGPTLAERLARGRFPRNDALTIAAQIAEAVDAAHEKGIIHRDLKPANIKFTADGRVKVLDFGLAKPIAIDADTPPSAPTMMATAAGAVLITGTPAYMSPEQARGDAVERTTDTWAFGCLVFEMLTGSPAFPGRTATDVIGAVLRAEPEWDRLPTDTPLALRLLLRRCLQKDPRRRLQHIGDARIEIDQLLTDPLAGAVSVDAPRRASRAGWIISGVLVAVLALVAVAAARYLQVSDTPARDVRFQLSVQGNGNIKISPDGAQIAYHAVLGGKGDEIWVRRLNSLDARVAVPDSEAAGGFTWSPDSRFLLYTGKDHKLKRVATTGGTPQTIADNASPRQPPSWGRDNVIVFQTEGYTIARVSASGGEPVDVTKLDASKAELAHMWPSFLPDGRHFLFLAWSVGPPSHATLYVGSIDPAAPRTRLMNAESAAFFAPPGYLLFTSGDTLMARPFDARRLQFAGDAVAVADDVAHTPPGYLGADASSDGTLIFRQGAQRRRPPMVWKDRDGTLLGSGCAAVPDGLRGGWRLSADGRRLATFSTSTIDLFLCDIDRDQSVRFTNDPYWDRSPVWSPNGSRIAYQSFRGRANSDSTIYEKAANGATPERSLLPPEPGTLIAPLDWSFDGRFIVFSKERPLSGTAARAGTVNRDLWILPMSGAEAPHPYLATPFDEADAALSADGRYLAYTTNEVGAGYEVVVQTFPDPTRGKWKVSTDGGCCPRWKRDGTELFYVNADQRLVVVPVTSGAAFEPGRGVATNLAVENAFPARDRSGTSRYDVTADGKKFLVEGQVPARPDNDETVPIVVLLNWTATLRR